jgi:hypothetical protein
VAIEGNNLNRAEREASILSTVIIVSKDALWGAGFGYKGARRVILLVFHDNAKGASQINFDGYTKFCLRPVWVSFEQVFEDASSRFRLSDDKVLSCETENETDVLIF